MKKRNILSNIAKVMAGSLLAATVLTAISPAMAAYADENESSAVAGEEAQTTGDEAETGEAASSEEVRKEFPDLNYDKGSIEINMKDLDGNIVSGGKLEIYKVAEVEHRPTEGLFFKYIEPFEGLKYQITEYSNFFNLDLIKDADAIAANVDPIQMIEIGTGEDGTKKGYGTTEENLELGVYLVRQTEEEAAEGYEAIKPFFVTIPHYVSTEKTDDGKFIRAQYNVDASPKLPSKGVNPKPPAPSRAYCEADPPVKKIVTGSGAGTGEEFYFEFKSFSNNLADLAVNPMPSHYAEAHDIDGDEVSINSDAGVQILKIKTKQGSGEIFGTTEAGTITFYQPGVYVYTYREISDRDELRKYGGTRYNYNYSSDVFFITYKVNYHEDGMLYLDEIDVRKSRSMNDPDGALTETEKPGTTRSDAVGADPISIEFTNTRRRSGGSENTPRDRSTVGPPTEAPTVAGAYREPEGGEDAGVLGAARTPQAVLGASRLPQTGQLWWPVPILFIGGVALMAGGLIKRRSDE